MKHVQTLRVRFALWTAGLLFVAFVLFGLFVYTNMARSLATLVDQALAATATELTGDIDIANSKPTFSENPIQDPQYAPLNDQGLSVRLLNLTGQTQQTFGAYQTLPVPQLNLKNAHASGQLTIIRDPATHDIVHVYTLPVVDEDQVVGILQVAMNLKDVANTLNLLLLTLLIGGPLIVLGVAGGGYILAARALAPIDQITRTARHISATDLTERLNLPATEDEVGRLAATFDSMLSRLEDGFRRERQFTADASHELRTPLSAIQTIIGSTLARERTVAEYKQALLDLNRETRQIRTLTEGLLQLARNDATQQPAKFEPVDLGVLLKDVADSLRPLAEERGLQLLERVPTEGLILPGDSDGLIRLFVNLLDNAIKYTEQGAITLAAQPQNGKWLVVNVQDTGVGIAPEHLPHLFDRFYRVEEARSKEGIGLGLAIAQNIALAHGGQITVTSQLGKGTTFTVRLAMQTEDRRQ
ncbi:MAG: ATP-binding protein [Caldilineaceae bacterium]